MHLGVYAPPQTPPKIPLKKFLRQNIPSMFGWVTVSLLTIFRKISFSGKREDPNWHHQRTIQLLIIFLIWCFSQPPSLPTSRG